MKNWNRRIRRAITDALDLPQDVTMEMPRITLIGDVQLYIENHRGVIQFHDRELRLLLTKGQLLVQGENLVIQTIWPEEVLVAGKINSVQYIDS